MRATLRALWPPTLAGLLKFVLVAAIIFWIGRRFALDLQDNPGIWKLPLRPGWLAVSAVLYLLGLGFWALYWHRLLYRLGQRPPTRISVPAYYMSQLGKYLPGKAWALFLRAALVRGPRVRTGVAVASSFYEVFTTMSAGAFIAAAVFTWKALTGTAATGATSWRSFVDFVERRAPDSVILNTRLPLVMAIVLVAVTAIPIVPPVFNRIVYRLARPFRQQDSEPLPRFRFPAVLEGFVITGASWFVLSASLYAALRGLLPAPLPWTWGGWVNCTAYLALAYVAGFIIVILPSGLGVRELLLTPFLAHELQAFPEMAENQARALAVLAVIGLRLIWTAAEMLTIGALYFLVPRIPEPSLP